MTYTLLPGTNYTSILNFSYYYLDSGALLIVFSAYSWFESSNLIGPHEVIDFA